ncbi:MAG TPA: hypothetical protein VNI34_00685 [Candidatus Nitrosotalea sp.]|nr:hypothetical protein [Candidatus Nitrosotalea sp.]
MIDQANLAIARMREEIEVDNQRRYRFQRLLQATDEVLWRLEEMNLAGERRISDPFRAQFRGTLDELPDDFRRIYRDSEVVQETLDSIFEIQERLFRERDPEWDARDQMAESLSR